MARRVTVATVPVLGDFVRWRLAACHRRLDLPKAAVAGGPCCPDGGLSLGGCPAAATFSTMKRRGPAVTVAMLIGFLHQNINLSVCRGCDLR